MESLIKEWQEKYEDAKNHYQGVVANIEDNDEAYRGVRKIKNPQGQDAKKQGCVSRKMCFELVETQADIVIPMPRVLSKKGREDCGHAQQIRAMRRSSLCDWLRRGL